MGSTQEKLGHVWVDRFGPLWILPLSLWIGTLAEARLPPATQPSTATVPSPESKACAADTTKAIEAFHAEVAGKSVPITSIETGKQCTLSDQSLKTKVNGSPKHLCSNVIEAFQRFAHNLAAKIQANCGTSRGELDACTKQGTVPAKAACFVKFLTQSEPARLQELRQILATAHQEAGRLDQVVNASIATHRQFRDMVNRLLLQDSRNRFRSEIPGNPDSSTIVGAPTYAAAQTLLGNGAKDGPLIQELNQTHKIVTSIGRELTVKAGNLQSAITSLPAEAARLEPLTKGMVTAGLGPDGQPIQRTDQRGPPAAAANVPGQPRGPTPGTGGTGNPRGGAPDPSMDALSGLMKQAGDMAAKAAGANGSSAGQQPQAGAPAAPAVQTAAAERQMTAEATAPRKPDAYRLDQITNNGSTGARVLAGTETSAPILAAAANRQALLSQPRAVESGGAVRNTSGVSLPSHGAAYGQAGSGSAADASAGTKACKSETCQAFSASSQFQGGDQLSLGGGVINSSRGSAAGVVSGNHSTEAGGSAVKSLLGSLDDPFASKSADSALPALFPAIPASPAATGSISVPFDGASRMISSSGANGNSGLDASPMAANFPIAPGEPGTTRGTEANTQAGFGNRGDREFQLQPSALRDISLFRRVHLYLEKVRNAPEHSAKITSAR